MQPPTLILGTSLHEELLVIQLSAPFWYIITVLRRAQSIDRSDKFKYTKSNNNSIPQILSIVKVSTDQKWIIRFGDWANPKRGGYRGSTTLIRSGTYHTDTRPTRFEQLKGCHPPDVRCSQDVSPNNPLYQHKIQVRTRRLRDRRRFPWWMLPTIHGADPS